MKKICASAAFVLGAASKANAANYGTDLNLAMPPVSGGMAGVGIATPLDVMRFFVTFGKHFRDCRLAQDGG